ncbi:MAG: TauD/TfdA family dioxygenase [Gammaproteobacteria bacterium]
MNSQPRPADALTDAIAALGHGVRCHWPFPGSPPLFVEPVAAPLMRDRGAVIDWFRARTEAFDRIASEAGAYVLRGFPLRTAEDFSALTVHLPPMPLGYSGGATPRKAITGNVYEATQVPAMVQILLHQEMAYLHRYPAELGFFCQVAPDSGGETIIGDMRRFQAGLPEPFLREIADKGVSYHRNFRASDVPHPCEAHPRIYHATLAQGFGTDDRAEVEAQCRALGMTWRWLDDGSLSTRLDRPGFAVHRLTGRPVYFNHFLTQIMDLEWLGDTAGPYLDMYDRAGRPRPYHTTFGDGSEVTAQDYRRISAGLRAVTVGFPWQPGDVMILDNVHTAHGRNPYTGTRNVQVVMIDAPAG